MLIGCTTFGGQTVSLRMLKKSHFTKWAYRIIICGYTTIKLCSTCLSGYLAYIITIKHLKNNTFKFLIISYTFFRLTLVLSCAMKFESYPHDTQICFMMIESCEFRWNIVIKYYIICILNLSSIAVSHTVEDLVFIWNMTDPLVVNSEIELPQLDISNNYTTDCTIEYSTGIYMCDLRMRKKEKTKDKS